MRAKLIAAAATLVATVIVAVGLSVGLSAHTPCEHEDSSDCHWSAQVRGNGVGDSFLDMGGIRIPWH